MVCPFGLPVALQQLFATDEEACAELLGNGVAKRGGDAKYEYFGDVAAGTRGDVGDEDNTVYP